MKQNLLVVCVVMCCNNFMQAQSLTVHEWGTFTARFNDLGEPYLNMHQRVDEALPSFVNELNFYNSSFDKLVHNIEKGWSGWAYGKNLKINNCSIKMETPVLYFYSPVEIQNLKVEVLFSKGSISQFYPMPLIYEDTSYIKSKLTYSLNGPSSTNSNQPIINLNLRDYNGKATWDIKVKKEKNISSCTYKSDTLPTVWTAPRNVDANLISSNGNTEKYIFYRGIGGFENPINLKYTKNKNIEIKNILNQQISYVLFYEKLSDGSVNIWDVTKLNKLETKIIQNHKINISTKEWENTYKRDFLLQLTKSGLYIDEANAMLNTWQYSYFETPGLKVFYIVPSNFIDSILPLKISEPTQDLKRVFVGRTEIDSFNNDNIALYSSEKITDSDSVLQNEKTDLLVFPNPSNGIINLLYNGKLPINVKYYLYSSNSKLVYKTTSKIYPSINNPLFEQSPPLAFGVYQLIIESEIGVKKIQLIIK